MIKLDDLREFRPKYRFADGANMSLEIVKEALQIEANKLGIPIAFYPDQVKSGSLFTKQVEDCLVMYHPGHKNDYFTFCIRVQHQGNLAYVIVNDFGASKQMDKFARAEFAKQDRQGKELSYKIGSMIGSGLRNMGKSKQKLEEEQTYYDAIQCMLDRVIC